MSKRQAPPPDQGAASSGLRVGLESSSKHPSLIPTRPPHPGHDFRGVGVATAHDPVQLTRLLCGGRATPVSTLYSAAQRLPANVLDLLSVGDALSQPLAMGRSQWRLHPRTPHAMLDTADQFDHAIHSLTRDLFHRISKQKKPHSTHCVKCGSDFRWYRALIILQGVEEDDSEHTNHKTVEMSS